MWKPDVIGCHFFWWGGVTPIGGYKKGYHPSTARWVLVGKTKRTLSKVGCGGKLDSRPRGNDRFTTRLFRKGKLVTATTARAAAALFFGRAGAFGFFFLAARADVVFDGFAAFEAVMVMLAAAIAHI